MLGPPVVPFDQLVWGFGFPYKNRPQKKGYPSSNLSTGGPRMLVKSSLKSSLVVSDWVFAWQFCNQTQIPALLGRGML